MIPRVLKFLMPMLLIPVLVMATPLESSVVIDHPGLAAIVRSMYGPNAEVVCTWMYEGFSDGGSNDLPEGTIAIAKSDVAKLDADLRLLIVAGSNPLRYDRKYGGHNPKISAKSNAALRLDRAQWFNAQIGYRADVYPPGLANDRKAVYLIAVRVPEVRAPERVIVCVEHTPTAFPDWFRAGAGWTGVQCQQLDVGLPMASLAAGWNLGRTTSIGAYAAGGVNLGSPNDRTMHAGVELKPLPAMFFRLGYRNGAVEIPGDGHSLARFEGPEFGAGLRSGVLEIGLYASPGKYADVNDRRWRDETLVAIEVTLGNRVRPEGR